MDDGAGMAAGPEEQLVLFRIAGQTYGLDIHCVQRLLAMPAVTRIPGAPGCVAGVTEVRGQVVPLIDMRRRLGQEPADEAESRRVVIVESGGSQVGLVVDAVTEVFRLPASAVEAREETAVSLDDPLVRGIGKDGQRLIILLDNEEILAPEEQGQLGALVADAAELDPAGNREAA